MGQSASAALASSPQTCLCLLSGPRAKDGIPRDGWPADLDTPMSLQLSTPRPQLSPLKGWPAHGPRTAQLNDSGCCPIVTT